MSKAGPETVSAPLELDGEAHASGEGFRQGPEFRDGAERRRVAQLHGVTARNTGAAGTAEEAAVHGGKSIRTGSPDHCSLMEAACGAKFHQNEDARDALRAPPGAPLVHRTRRGSENTPDAVMAEILTRIREESC